MVMLAWLCWLADDADASSVSRPFDEDSPVLDFDIMDSMHDKQQPMVHRRLSKEQKDLVGVPVCWPCELDSARDQRAKENPFNVRIGLSLSSQ